MAFASSVGVCILCYQQDLGARVQVRWLVHVVSSKTKNNNDATLSSKSMNNIEACGYCTNATHKLETPFSPLPPPPKKKLTSI